MRTIQRAYGLRLASALALPELVLAEGAGDVCIRQARLDLPVGPLIAGRYVRATATEAQLYWPDVGMFLVRDGREIVVDAAPAAPDALLRTFVLGPILAVLLAQRGHLLLHGSAVVVGGQAAAMLGFSGAGKSTTAAALYRRGHALLADDMVVLRPGPGAPWVLPGIPQIKLWPEAARALGADPAALPRLHPAGEKRVRPAAAGFPAAPVPLRRIYVLAEGTTLCTEPLSGQAAIMELVRHSWGAQILVAPAARARHFAQCAALAQAVPLARLVRPPALDGLPALAQLVEHEMAAGERAMSNEQ